MRALKIDFAPKRQLPAWAWYTASAILFAIAAQQGWAAWQLREKTLAIEAQIAQLQAKAAQAERERREAEARANIPPPYAKEAAELARVAAFPIEKVFARIEAVQIGSVKMTSLDISPVDGTVRIEIEFGDETALLHYVEALNDGEARPRWLLAEARMNTPGSPNVATLTSHWP